MKHVSRNAEYIWEDISPRNSNNHQKNRENNGTNRRRRIRDGKKEWKRPYRSTIKVDGVLTRLSRRLNRGLGSITSTHPPTAPREVSHLSFSLHLTSLSPVYQITHVFHEHLYKSYIVICRKEMVGLARPCRASCRKPETTPNTYL